MWWQIAGLGASAIGGLLGQRSARKREDRIQRQISEYDRFDPTNAYQDMPISTMGSDIIREDAAGMSASLVDAAMMGGARGVYSALPGITRMNQNASREAALLVDQQLQNKAQMVAGDEVRLQNEYLQRDRENLAGLGAQLNAAQQERADYTRGLMNLPFAAGSMLPGLGGAKKGGGFMLSDPGMIEQGYDPLGGADYSNFSNYFNNKRQRSMFDLATTKYGF